MLNYKSSFLIAQIVSAMAAVIKNSGDLDVCSWPEADCGQGEYACDALIDCKVYLVGYESLNISKVTVRFDVVFDKCTFDDAEKEYEWNSKEVNIFGGACSHNLTFENDKGEVVESYGANGFLEKFDNIDDEYITQTIIESVFAQLSSEEKERYLKDVLRAYNLSRKDFRAAHEARQAQEA